MNTLNILKCPVCQSSLFKEEKSYYCTGEKRHCFDISAAGHTNLCPGRATGGDDKRAVKSRTDFLTQGYYEPISSKICELLSELGGGASIIDAGCGEGYYSNNIARATGSTVYGFDLSKEAIISASKSAKRQSISNAQFFVGGIYDLPIKNGGADAIVNIFAPCAEEEFTRALKNEGLLVVATAGRDHLLGLKNAIYDNVYPNEIRALPKHLVLEGKHTVSYVIEINDSETVRNLFSMTPYSYRTSEKDMQKLLSLTSLKTEVQVDIFVYRKRETK